MTTGDTLAACEGRLAVGGGGGRISAAGLKGMQEVVEYWGGGRWACDPGGGMHMGGGGTGQMSGWG